MIPSHSCFIMYLFSWSHLIHVIWCIFMIQPHSCYMMFLPSWSHIIHVIWCAFLHDPTRFLLHMNRNVRKGTFWHVRPTKIHAVCSVFVVRMLRLCFLGYPIYADAQADLNRLTWIFAGRTLPEGTFSDFVTLWLNNGLKKEFMFYNAHVDSISTFSVLNLYSTGRYFNICSYCHLSSTWDDSHESLILFSVKIEKKDRGES